MQRFITAMILLFIIAIAPSSCKPPYPTPLPIAELPEWQGIIIGQDTIMDVKSLLGESLYATSGYLRGIDIEVFLDPSTGSRIFVEFCRTDGIVQFIRPDIVTSQ